MPKLVIFLLSILCSGLSIAQKINLPDQKQLSAVTFEENKGQISDQYHKPRPDVLFSGHANGMTFHLRNSGISYQLSRVDEWKETRHPKTSQEHKVPAKQTIYRVDLNWRNANSNPRLIKESALSYVKHYYLSVCPEGIHNVKTFAGVKLEDLYSGIDLHYYEKEGSLKYDYIVKPRADHRQIVMELSGAAEIEAQADGSLLIKTPLGGILEGKPLVYQAGKQLKARWKVEGTHLSFDIIGADPELPLIIDPAVRTWGTYFGGNYSDYGNASATDPNGNVYIAGETTLGNNIATTGSHQMVYAGGGSDGFLAKFDASGARLWSTYYGGTAEDPVYACATDGNGNVFIGGFTNSNTGTVVGVIATPGSQQPIYGGGNSGDSYLVKFNSAGVRQWGTFVGGPGDEHITSCATDASGNIFVAGWTTNTGSGMVGTNGHQPVFTGGNSDAFLVKYNAAGVLQWGTYYGREQDDEGYGCATDPGGNVYLVGLTVVNTATLMSPTTTMIATPGCHQPLPDQSLGWGTVDGFIAKFNSAGVRQWGTFYSDTGDERIFSCACDGLGYVYVAGNENGSSGGTAVATLGSHQPSISAGPNDDAFLAKFDPSGVRQWGTFYGDNTGQGAAYCVADPSGNVYLAGSTASFVTGSAIATPGSYQQQCNGWVNAFLVKFSNTGIRQWGTYYGGDGFETGISCALDVNNNRIYLAGTCTSTLGIASTGAFQQNYGGSYYDAFLVQFSDCAPDNVTPPNAQQVCANSFATLNALGSGTISWYATATSTAVLATGPVYVIPGLSAGTYTYYIGSLNCGPGSTRTAVTLTVLPVPVITVNSGTTCAGDSFTIVPSGAVSYTFSAGSPVVNPLSTTSYSVIGTSSAGCTSTAFAVSYVTVFPLPVIQISSSSVCFGKSLTLQPGGASTYTYSSGSPVVSPTVTSTYTITGTSSAGCISAVPAICQIVVNPLPPVSAVNANSIICAGETTSLTADGAVSYTWNAASQSNPLVITPTITTSYTLAGTDANGCSNTAVITQSVDACLSVKQLAVNSLQLAVYPNPNKGEFIIENYEWVSIRITNALGQLILEKQLTEGKNEMDLSAYAKGIYFIQFKREKAGETVRLIKN